MSVVFKPFVIVDIIEMQKAESSARGMTFMKNPDLDMYRIVAVLKDYIKKTGKGRRLLKKLGHGDKMDELDMKYLEYQEAFTVMIPVTHKTLNMNNYHVGGEIMVAYYPINVWASFHMDGQPDNNDDKRRLKE